MNGKKCGIIVMAPFCHPQAKNIIKVSRIVIFPEFQGFGIAARSLDLISQYFHDQKNRIRITTSHPGILQSLNNNKKWICCCISKNNKTNKKEINKPGRIGTDRYTTSWEYIS